MKNLTGIKVAILAADGFEQVELEKPQQALKDAGAETFIISPETGKVQGWKGEEKADFFPVDIALDVAEAADFDALLLPGGVVNPDTLRTLPKAVAFVKAMHEKNSPIAAICHGPWLLINAEIIKGCRVTSWASIKIDLINAGARWEDSATVCDNNILTSRKPDDIPQFNEAMIDLFQKKPA